MSTSDRTTPVECDTRINSENFDLPNDGLVGHANDNVERSLVEPSVYSKAQAKKLDKFYTATAVAALCLTLAKRFINGHCLIEPSAGSGNMLDVAKAAGFKCYSFDIAPEANRLDIQKLDYLAGPIRAHLPDEVKGMPLAAFMNPPFGNKGKLALSFVNKALAETAYVCAILPRCATEWSFQKHVTPGGRLVLSELLSPDSFTLCGELCSVDCVFQIWTMFDVGKDLRIGETPLLKKPDFKMVRYNCSGDPSVLKGDWEFAVRAQAYGDAAGVRLERGSDLNPKHQWMMFWPYNVGARIILNGIDFKGLCRGTTSVKGFGKAHVITAYNEALQAANDASPSIYTVDGRVNDGEAY